MYGCFYSSLTHPHDIDHNFWESLKLQEMKQARPSARSAIFTTFIEANTTSQLAGIISAYQRRHRQFITIASSLSPPANVVIVSPSRKFVRTTSQRRHRQSVSLTSPVNLPRRVKPAPTTAFSAFVRHYRESPSPQHDKATNMSARQEKTP